MLLYLHTILNIFQKSLSRMPIWYLASSGQDEADVVKHKIEQHQLSQAEWEYCRKFLAFLARKSLFRRHLDGYPAVDTTKLWMVVLATVLTRRMGKCHKPLAFSGLDLFFLYMDCCQAVHLFNIGEEKKSVVSRKSSTWMKFIPAIQGFMRAQSLFRRSGVRKKNPN